VARRDLASAVRREQDARRKREVVQAQAQARARARSQAEAQARWREAQAQEAARRRAYAQARAGRARPQSLYGFPFGFHTSPYAAQYDDDENEQEIEGEQYSNLADYLSAFSPRMSCRSRSAPHTGDRSHSQAGPQSDNVNEREKATNVEEAGAETESSVPTRVSSEASEDSTELNHAARSSALDRICNISAKLDELRSSFTLPAVLEFDSSHVVKPRTTLTASEEGEVFLPYKLAYAPVNAPIHGHLDGLLKLLQELDAVESGGDDQVRRERREVVKAVEAEMARVDSEVARIWAESQPIHAVADASKTMQVEGASHIADENVGALTPVTVDVVIQEEEATSGPSETDDALTSATNDAAVDVAVRETEADVNSADEETVDTLMSIDVTDMDDDTQDAQPSLVATIAHDADTGRGSPIALPHPQEAPSYPSVLEAEPQLMVDVVPQRTVTALDAGEDEVKMIDVEVTPSRESTSAPITPVEDHSPGLLAKAEVEDDGILVGHPEDDSDVGSPLKEKALSDHWPEFDFEML